MGLPSLSVNVSMLLIISNAIFSLLKKLPDPSETVIRSFRVIQNTMSKVRFIHTANVKRVIWRRNKQSGQNYGHYGSEYASPGTGRQVSNRQARRSSPTDQYSAPAICRGNMDNKQSRLLIVKRSDYRAYWSAASSCPRATFPIKRYYLCPVSGLLK